MSTITLDGRTPMTQPNNGKIPLKSEHVIRALQEENSIVREQNVTLRAMFFQCQSEAQEQINSLRAENERLQLQVDQLQQPPLATAEAR